MIEKTDSARKVGGAVRYSAPPHPSVAIAGNAERGGFSNHAVTDRREVKT